MMRIKNIILLSILSTNLALAGPAVVITADKVNFHPAPGFPKGAQIVILRGDLSKAEPYTIRFK